MKVADIANGIISTASTSDLKNLKTLKTICNSDSAFVVAVKKYQAYQRLLQKAFLLSRTWQKLGQARTWKITIRALRVALMSLVSGFKRTVEVVELPILLQKQIDKLIKADNFRISCFA